MSETKAWCPQCGPHVGWDEDGCCDVCGATATGFGAERACALLEESMEADAIMAAKDNRIAALEAEVSTLRAQLASMEVVISAGRALGETAIANTQVLLRVCDALGCKDNEPPVEVARALRTQLAAAQTLRLGRAPTVEEVEKHGVGVGRWLVHFTGDAADRWHEVCFQPCEDEDARPTDFMIDDVGWTDIAVDYDDSIPLDSNGQPCPCGGWGSR